MAKTIYTYDLALASIMAAEGYIHKARGLYARSGDDFIWKGLFVTFHQRKTMLDVQPNISVYCPRSFEIVEEGLGHVAAGSHSSIQKLGYPLVSYPLYERVSVLYDIDRFPYSYNVTGVSLENSINLVVQDFQKVSMDVFGGISDGWKLRNRILFDPSGVGTGGAVYAMALTYLLDNKITAQDVDSIASTRPSIMTNKFATFMKRKISGEV